MDPAYEAFRQKLDEFLIPCPPGPGILEFLEIVFTVEEVKMLSKFKSFQKFVSIEEFARENGYKVEVVDRIFNDLGRRGLIRYEQRNGIGKYCLYPLVMGIYEGFFSAWREQDPEKLLPAALAMEKYFNSVFFNAVGNSRSPWARVIPHMNTIDAIIEKHPELYGEDDSSNDQVQRSAEIVNYGAREFTKKVSRGDIKGAFDMVANDGPVMLDAVVKGIRSFFAARPPPKKRPAPKEIPVGKVLTSQLEIHPFEVIRHYINLTTEIVVAPCACRSEHEILKSQQGNEGSQECNHPHEDACMMLLYGDREAHPYNMWGGRKVTREEAFQILERCEKAGLVHTTFNSKDKIEFICNCCPCCCGIIGTMTRYNMEHRAFVSSNFLPRVEESTCSSCGKCASICPVGAIRHEKGMPVILEKKCIGCGACTSNCPTGAMSLEKVRDDEPCLDAVEAYVKFSNKKIK